MTPKEALSKTNLDFDSFLCNTRRHLHQHPEIGFSEFETCRFIQETLTAHGLEVKGPIARTGLFVDIVGNPNGPCIGYRADIDALPTHDAKTTPYRSQKPGLAHLCGHDVHTTIAMGLALKLYEHRDELDGTIRVFFQPNEEGNPSGAPHMIKDGVLKDLEAVYAIHVDPSLPVGSFGIRSGAITAAAIRFVVHIHAESTGHSARPHEATDTVWLANQLAQQFYSLAGRITDCRDATVLTICRFRAGEALNVIPRDVEFGGTLRTTSLDARDRICTQMQDLVDHFATLYTTTIELELDEGVPPVINDDRLARFITLQIESSAGNHHIHSIDRPSMGAEDFAYYLQNIPGLLLRVGTASGPLTSFPLHDAHFDIDERAMASTVDLMQHILANHLTTNPLID